MALPEHKYYTLKQAAKKAGCEIEDLIHFAAIGVLQLCTKIPPNGFYVDADGGSDEYQSVNLSTEFVFDSEKIDENTKGVQPDGAIVCVHKTDYFYAADTIRFEGNNIISVSCLQVDGLLGINSSDVYEVEQDLIDDDSTLFAIQFMPPRTENETYDQHYWVYDVSASNLLVIRRDSLLVTAYEMSLLLTGGKSLDDSPTPYTPNKPAERENFSVHKSSLIYYLVQLAFSADGGISNLSNEAIAEQIQEKLRKAGIPYNEISPYNIRNWIGRYKGNRKLKL
ncbi:hypothetical protein [Pectobacterium brasiliense]|uniref:hypothetical protein n=1 Tax=Pectobacterium brasiliense TaxID=180957 RepID=UPI0019D349DF|nr:hypothetical protein [Pectobacterium brasiliense]MBN7767357.1 hypothetical protein [Pectobacterium brasiliense]